MLDVVSARSLAAADPGLRKMQERWPARIKRARCPRAWMRACLAGKTLRPRKFAAAVCRCRNRSGL